MKDWKTWAIVALAAWCAWLTTERRVDCKVSNIGASVESHLQAIVDDYVKENNLGNIVESGKRPMRGVIESHFWGKYTDDDLERKAKDERAERKRKSEELTKEIKEAYLRIHDLNSRR